MKLSEVIREQFDEQSIWDWVVVYSEATRDENAQQLPQRKEFFFLLKKEFEKFLEANVLKFNFVYRREDEAKVCNER